MNYTLSYNNPTISVLERTTDIIVSQTIFTCKSFLHDPIIVQVFDFKLIIFGCTSVQKEYGKDPCQVIQNDLDCF